MHSGAEGKVLATQVGYRTATTQGPQTANVQVTSGGDEGTRTPNPRLAKAALSDRFSTPTL